MYTPALGARNRTVRSGWTSASAPPLTALTSTRSLANTPVSLARTFTTLSLVAGVAAASLVMVTFRATRVTVPVSVPPYPSETV